MGLFLLHSLNCAVTANTKERKEQVRVQPDFHADLENTPIPNPPVNTPEYDLIFQKQKALYDHLGKAIDLMNELSVDSFKAEYFAEPKQAYDASRIWDYNKNKLFEVAQHQIVRYRAFWTTWKDKE